MAKREVVWVKPAKQGGWDVTKQGGQQISHHVKKDPAVDRAVREAKSADLGQVKIQKQDGTIQEERTYRKDPERHPG